MRWDSVRKPRVLCVDDEPEVLRALQWLLGASFEVSCTTDAREGRARLRCDDFEVVISDLRMPQMLGTEMLQWARIESPNTMRLMLAEPPDFAEVVDAVNASEVFRLLPKPWDAPQLLDTVDYAAAVARSVPLIEPEGAGGGSIREEEAVVLLDPDPAIESQVRACLDAQTRLYWARSPGEADALLARHAVAVLVVEPQIGSASTLELIHALNSRQPHAVPVALSAERDPTLLIRLINEAQIFRFLSKPVVHPYARRTVQAALAQHRALLAQPLRTARHAVQRPANGGQAFV